MKRRNFLSSTVAACSALFTAGWASRKGLIAAAESPAPTTSAASGVSTTSITTTAPPDLAAYWSSEGARQRAGLLLGFLSAVMSSLTQRYGQHPALISYGLNRKARNACTNWLEHLYQQHGEALRQWISDAEHPRDWFWLGESLWKAVTPPRIAAQLCWSVPGNTFFTPQKHQLALELLRHPVVFPHLDAQGQICFLRHSSQIEHVGPWPRLEEVAAVEHGYLSALLWAEEDRLRAEAEEAGHTWPLELSSSQVSAETLERVHWCCKSFVCRARHVLDQSQVLSGLDGLKSEGLPFWSRVGHDLYLTTAGHGAGFWDGDWLGLERPFTVEQPDPGRELTEICEQYLTPEPGVGDDGLVYLVGGTPVACPELPESSVPLLLS